MATSHRFDSSRLNLLSELIEVCSVPVLIQDVEDNPIDKGIFTEFMKILDVNLPVLLDLLCQSDFLQELTTEDDNDLVLLRKRLIMMMCEHASILPGLYPPYTSDNHDLWIQLNRICSLSAIATPSLLHDCLSTYKDRLLSNKWRRDMGSSHGFVHFCHLYLQSLGAKVDLQMVLFILSMASQFIDCIHGEVKVLGLRLYSIILTQCPSELVLDANVHKVVIKSCLEDSQKLFNDDCLLLLWDDVVQAVTLDEKMMSDLNWNELDDGLHLLFQRIKLEGKRGMRQKLRRSLMQVIKVCYGREAKDMFKGEDLIHVQQEMMRRTSVRENEKLFRWITDLKELFIFECLSVSNCAESTEEALRFITESYLLTMSGLSYTIIGSTLEDLTQRITPLLLEIYRLHSGNEGVIRAVTEFLQMLLTHLDMITENRTPSSYHMALKQLVKEHLISVEC